MSDPLKRLALIAAVGIFGVFLLPTADARADYSYIVMWATELNKPLTAFGISYPQPTSDFNNDSYPDIFVQLSTYDFTLLSGTDGQELWSFSENPDWVRAAIGNTDSDSTLEIIMAHIYFDTANYDTSMPPRPVDGIMILDAATGEIEYTWPTEVSQSMPTLVDVDNDGMQEILILEGPNLVVCYKYSEDVGISDHPGQISVPGRFKLDQNYPNPFNPGTTISYTIDTHSQVSVTVYNVQGQAVRHLVNEPQNAGEYTMEWDGTDNHGSLVASGIYFYRLTTDDFAAAKKMLLLK
jgi:hypothetical protein